MLVDSLNFGYWSVVSGVQSNDSVVTCFEFWHFVLDFKVRNIDTGKFWRL